MKIILCVTGSIAATEDLKLVHELQRHGFDVECFMTESAAEIITPLSMEFATKKRVVTKLTGYVEHVTNAQADLILVAPATANTITKYANKIADTTVTTLLLTASGYKTPILFVPSMHISMYDAIKDKIDDIKSGQDFVHFMDPYENERKAKFPSKEDIVLEVERLTSGQKLKGKHVLVSTGGTFESIDAMRGITNRSSGKMGVEIAKQAYIQGADVTLLCGITHTHIPNVFNRINVESTSQMMETMKEIMDTVDVYVSAAAISDFKIDNTSDKKISSEEDVTIKFTKLPKLLKQIKQLNPHTFVVGFKAEAGLSEEELINKARKRMVEYDTDLMVANDILVENGGPGSDNNEVYILDGKDYVKVPLAPKKEIAEVIIGEVIKKL